MRRGKTDDAELARSNELGAVPGAAGEEEKARAEAATRGDGAVPDPEVVEGPKRRRFTAEYKLKILREADACSASGEIGALLRREGLYSSQLSQWRAQRAASEQAGMRPQKRGCKASKREPAAQERDELRREVERLRERLSETETVIDFQKKLCEILELPLRTSRARDGDEQ